MLPTARQDVSAYRPSAALVDRPIAQAAGTAAQAAPGLHSGVAGALLSTAAVDISTAAVAKRA
jgi:hypothetical protein